MYMHGWVVSWKPGKRFYLILSIYRIKKMHLIPIIRSKSRNVHHAYKKRYFVNQRERGVEK